MSDPSEEDLEELSAAIQREGRRTDGVVMVPPGMCLVGAFRREAVMPEDLSTRDGDALALRGGDALAINPGGGVLTEERALQLIEAQQKATLTGFLRAVLVAAEDARGV